MAIKKLRTQRDNQQWMLDLALNMRGRVQNFELDETEAPHGKRAHNYQMYPKVWRETAEHHEALARRAHEGGFRHTAAEHYDNAIQAYRMAQHPIFYDDNPVKLYLCSKLGEMVDLRAECCPNPIERVEVPFDEGKTISCLFHLLPDRRKAPCLIYVPGMDQTKESFPRAFANPGIARGFHVISMDGPGQGNSNIQKIRAVGDNYERAGAAVIDYLLGREEVDPSHIYVLGVSMGSFWSLRLASYDHRIAGLVSAIACFNPNNTIFSRSSPRFKQMFMYMAGMDEEEFDEMAAGMTVKGYAEKIRCPVLLATGEFDPLCPLEDAVEVYSDVTSPKEMWVFENQFHILWSIENLGGLGFHQYMFDWLNRHFIEGGGLPAGHDRTAYIEKGGDGPFGECEWTPPVGPGEVYF